MQLRILPAQALAIAVFVAHAGTGGDLSAIKADLGAKIECLDRTLVQEDISRYSVTGEVARRVDRFGTLAEVIDGVERYSHVRRNGREYPIIGRIPGVRSFGEMSTILRTTLLALDECALQRRSAAMEGVPVDELRFHYPSIKRRWYAVVGTRLYWLDFDGELMTDASSGEVVFVRWVASSLPVEAGIERIEWTVRYHPEEIAGQVLVVPQKSEFRVTHPGYGRPTDLNITTFESWKRYGSRVSVDFGDSLRGALIP